MSIDILGEIGKYEEEIKALRREIHRHPELGNDEWRTAQLAEDHLKRLGIETRRVLGTGIIGYLKGNGDRTAAIRADMDALPLDEETGAGFASETPGIMHACGHDVHTAALLGAASVLAGHRDELPGNVVFLLQPDEEGRGGAERMIREGCLDGVDAVFGAHVSPDLPAGHIGVRYGKFYAASDMFEVTVTGRESHGAERGKGIDALAAASEMVTELLRLPQTVTSDKCVLTVGVFSSGTAGNIMPGRARFEGIIRTLGQETRLAMEQAFRDTVSRIGEKTCTGVTVNYRHSYPGVVNDEAMTRLAESAAAEMLGCSCVRRIEEPTMTTEDFGYYLMKVPGTFYHIGAGCSLPLHNPSFIPQEETAVRLAAVHAGLVLAYLENVL